MTLHDLFPKMFHRRLVLLLAVGLGVGFTLAAQLTHLTVLKADTYRANAESRLSDRDFLPTYRGSILDRNGTPLALDEECYDIAVSYVVISGSWALKEAGYAARDAAGPRWGELGPEERVERISEHLPEYEAQVDQMWREIRTSGGLTEQELTQRLDDITTFVERTTDAVQTRWREEYYRKHGYPRPGETDTFDPHEVREQKDSYVILPRVSEDVAFYFKRRAEELPGLSVQDSWRRVYPWSTATVAIDLSSLPRELRGEGEQIIRIEGAADHMIGDVRERLYQEDLESRPFFKSDGSIDLKGYRIGDSIGRRGLERVFEDHLRGSRGMINARLDTGEEARTPRAPGEVLYLTIDIRLQARVQALLSPQLGLARVQQWQAGWTREGEPNKPKLPLGTPLFGSAVVLDIDTGEILAMVSTPTIAEGSRMSDAMRSTVAPFVNRPIETPYPPGSIIKPLVLAGATAEGVHDVQEGIVCTGHFFEDRGSARCWIYRDAYNFATHSPESTPVDAESAIAKSCNIYFYTLADKLGMARLVKWYRRFGLGRIPDVGLIQTTTNEDGDLIHFGETAGDLPTEAHIARLRRDGRLRFATVIAGIGQGPITWSPLQAANAYATLARGGIFRRPELTQNDSRGDVSESRTDLKLKPHVVSRILEGLRRSVEEPSGTGHHITYGGAGGDTEPIINAEGVTVWAKTGTAQAPAYAIDDDGDDEADRAITGLDHAWFVGLVGDGEAGQARPRFAIAVVLEYGGSGGRTAGPIANQIIRALKAEGYL